MVKPSLVGGSWTLRALLLLVLVSVSSVHASLPVSQQYRIPIGAMFSKRDQSLLTAFKYGLWRQEVNMSAHLPKPGFSTEVITEEINEADPASVGRSVCHLLNRGIFTLMASTPAHLDYVSLVSYTNRFHMPTMFPAQPETYDLAVPKPTVEVNLKPNTWKAAMDLIRSKRWNSIVFLTDSQKSGHDRYQSFLRMASTTMRVERKEFAIISNGAEANMVLRRLQVSDRDNPKHVILDMDPQLAFQVLRYHKRDIYITKNNFFFLLLEPTLKSFWMKEMQNVLEVQALGFVLVDDDTEELVQEFIKNWSTLQPNEWPGAGQQSLSMGVMLAHDGALVLYEAYRRMLMAQPEFFTKVTRRGDRYVLGSRGLNCFQTPARPWEHGTLVTKYIRELYIPDGLTGQVQFDQNGQRRGYNLKIFQVTNEEAVQIGDWSDTSGLHITRNHDVLDRIPRLASNRTFIVTSILDQPYLMLKHPSKSGNDRFEGFCKDLADLLSKEMGFSYVIHLVKDGKYGVMNVSNNQWNGMIGEVIRQEADMVIASLTITSTRQEYVDFSTPFLSVGISMMAKKPGNDYIGLESSFLFFFSPFTKEVWICLLVVYIAMSILFFLIVRFSGAPDQVQEKADTRIGICDSFWFGCGSTLFRSSGIYPRSIASRILSSVWWFFTLAVMALYAANMATLLITEHMNPVAMINGKQFNELTFSSVMEEVVRNKEIKMGPVKHGSTSKFFENSIVPLHREFWEYLSQNPDMYSSSTMEGVERVRQSNGDYIFLIESMSNEYVNSQPPCDTLEIRGTFRSRGYGIAFHKGSDLRSEVNSALLRLEEKGELFKIYDKWWKPSCDKANRRKMSDLYHGSLCLSEMSGLFYALMIGTIIGAVVTAFELCYRKHHGNQHYSVSDLWMEMPKCY